MSDAVAISVVEKDGSLTGPSGGGSYFSKEFNLQFVFKGFQELDKQAGEYVVSGILKCYGCKWKVRLYPRGDNGEAEDPQHVMVYLCCVAGNKDNDGDIVARAKYRIFTGYHAVGSDTSDFRLGDSWGFGAVRQTVLDTLESGTLIVDVFIQVELENRPTWRPTRHVYCPCLQKMLQIIDDDKSADALFEVQQSYSSDENVTKTFRAHRFILEHRAPQLYELTLGVDPETPICISGVKSNEFWSLLHCIYGSGGSVSFDLCVVQDLLDAANCFGCTDVKLEAEATLVSEIELLGLGLWWGEVIDNGDIADLIAFGDSKCAPQLKETAMNYFVENAEAVMETDGYKEMKCDRILKEMVSALAKSKNDGNAPATSLADAGEDLGRMTVSALRYELESRGLDVDGSKKMLVDRLADDIAKKSQRSS